MKNRTITELYQALRPLLLRDVAVAVGGSGAAAGGMETHALSSNWHTGTLAETQAPWAATKNEWATALATHAALVDVHHAAVTAGDGIGVSGQQVSLLATVAGAGLTHASGVLAVGAGTLIAVGADAVGIATGANYQFIGTGSGTAAAWQNLSGLAGNGLTHASGVLAVGVSGLGLSVAADAVALASSSNVGDTPAASILASTAAGGLTLAALAVRGSVDITNGGDLTVAGSGAYAGSSVLFVDSSGGNVGIMGAPDPQFALDVVGPCRATWFVGPHAIQLKDVLLLSHFDGRQPFETNYSGETNGHMGQVATTSSLIFRPGKFGTKAAQMSAATANLLSNPSFETGITGWSATGGATLDQTTADAYIGAYAMRITHVAASTSGAIATYTTATQSTYTASAYVRSYIDSDIGDNVSLLLRFTYTDASTSDVSVNHTLTDAWARISVTATTNGAKTLSSVAVQLRDLLSGAAHYSLVDAVQLEESAFATGYCDGSLGSGHAWTGTAHASTSTRTAAQMTYPTAGNVHDDVGTVMAWVYVNRSDGTQTILRVTGSSAGNIYLLISSGNLAGYWGTAEVTGTAVSALAWHHVAMTYSGTTLALYIDGVQVATGTSSGFAGMPVTMSVGGQAGSALLHGLIDDFVIMESALEADGVRAVYESDAPVFAESSRFSFRATPQGLVWADDEGLWMRNATGSAVLGAYGASSTKSWAGVTLAPSDVVIGDGSRGGYVLWDDSAQTLSVQGTITALAGSIAGVLTIGTSGEIRQGTGTLGTDYTGLRVWRDSGIGRIGGYASNVLQWYAGTDGKLYAGGGNVAINASGIAIAPNYDSTSLTFTNVGEIYALYDAGFGGTLYFRAGYNRSKESNVLLEAYSGTTVKSSLQLGANGIISAIGALSMTEMTAPSAPASNGAYIYLDDNGSGKTRLMVRFSSGSAVQLAIQP